MREAAAAGWIPGLVTTPPAVMDERTSEERRLVDEARAGDVGAFEGLYRAHVERIHGLCLRMLGDWQLAEDLTQEIFLKVWERLPTFRGESRFTTWLHRLAVNEVIGELRRRGRWRERFTAPGDLPEPEDTPLPEPGGGVDLERAVAALPPVARLVFLLYDVEGYRHREIAEIAGMAEGTSKANLHRARNLLRKALHR
ncbi:MAG: RNA polymerase sigma factor [Thermoanaerobaculia bacterium]